MRAQTPSPKSVPLGTTTAARPGLGGRLSLAHDELEEEQRGFGGLFVFGEIAVNAALFFAAEGRVGEDHIHAVFVADFGELEAKSVHGSICGASRPCRSRFIWRADTAAAWLRSRRCSAFAGPAGLRRSCIASPDVERFDQEAAGAAGRIEHGFAELGIGDRDHEAHDGARRIELAGIARGVAHLAEHGFVESAERVQLVAGGEMDAVDLVDHIAQQVAVDHAVMRAFENGGDHIAPVVAVGALQAAQIGEQTRALCAIGPNGFFIVDEGDQFVAGDAVWLSPPNRASDTAVRWPGETLSGQLGLLFALMLHVIEELQEHDPGEHRQPIKIAIQPLVLAHDVAAGLHDGGKPLGSGQRLRFRFST